MRGCWYMSSRIPQTRGILDLALALSLRTWDYLYALPRIDQTVEAVQNFLYAFLHAFPLSPTSHARRHAQESERFCCSATLSTYTRSNIPFGIGSSRKTVISIGSTMILHVMIMNLCMSCFTNQNPYMLLDPRVRHSGTLHRETPYCNLDFSLTRVFVLCCLVQHSTITGSPDSVS